MYESAIINIQDNIEGMKINKGVRQRCLLTPIIFNAYIQEATDKTKEETNLDIKINCQGISMLRFTDDIAIIVGN